MKLEQNASCFMLPIIVAACPFSFCQHRNANPSSQFPNSRGKIDVLIIHHEPENRADHPTPKTMKRLPLRTNMERGGLLLMKWAESLEICARAFKQEIGSNHLHDVVGGG